VRACDAAPGEPLSCAMTMRRVYVSENRLIVGHLKDVLEQHGIPCVLKNPFLQGGAGELPPIECWPEIWVTEDRDYERAREVLDAVLAEQETAAPWTCPQCGERLEGQFTECWQCGASRPRET